LDSWEHPPAGDLARSDVDLNPGVELGAYEGLRAAAVLIPLIERTDGVSVLLTRRSDALRRHSGQIAFPGGGIDPGETAWQAALREADEEVGLPPGMVELAGLSTPFKSLTGFHVTPVVGWVDPGFEPRPNAAEVAEVFETPFDFLMDAANHEKVLREPPGGAARWVYSIRHRERVIWGLTAALVADLHERLVGPG
jgi:8-oxo-dGTP pyrophosphatase MutT (NUDIX family)